MTSAAAATSCTSDRASHVASTEGPYKLKLTSSQDKVGDYARRMADELLTIGEVAARTGLSTSALRFYEREGLLRSERTSGGQRRYPREVLRRVAFVRVAQSIGLDLEQIAELLESLPRGRTPTKTDWARLSRGWRPMLDERIATLERLRDQLSDCIGCGCLSLDRCGLVNRDDSASVEGPGPRYVLNR